MKLPALLSDNDSVIPQTEKILACNEKTRLLGLVFSEADAVMLVQTRAESLLASGRIEFGEGITAQLIDAFYTSPYLTQSNYADTIAALLQLFDTFKNELGDTYSDRELLTFMRDAFDGACAGSVEALESDVFPRLLTGREEDEKPLGSMTDAMTAELDGSIRGIHTGSREIELENIRRKNELSDQEQDGKVYDTVPELWEDKNGHILLNG